MNKGQKIYSFSVEEIRYIKAINAIGRINTGQGDQVQDIIRKRVNPRFNMCTSCSGVVATNFAKIVAWIEIFIGCEIDDFNEEDCEGLLEEKSAEAKEANDKTAEQEKIEAKEKQEEAWKEEAERREVEKKKQAKSQKAATNKRAKERENLISARAEKKEGENKVLEDARREREEEKADSEGVNKKAILVLLKGEHRLITERSELEAVGSAQEILDHVEATTGIKIDIDIKSKQAIINEALSINRKIADYADKNEELVNEIEAELKEESLKVLAEEKEKADKEAAEELAKGTSDDYDKQGDEDLKALCDKAEPKIVYTKATERAGLIKKLRLRYSETAKPEAKAEEKKEEKPSVVEKIKDATKGAIEKIKEAVNPNEKKEEKTDETVKTADDKE